MPAPFGPITAVIDPSRTENDTSASACTPPNDRESPATARTSGRASAATGAPAWARVRLSVFSAIAFTGLPEVVAVAVRAVARVIAR